MKVKRTSQIIGQHNTENIREHSHLQKRKKGYKLVARAKKIHLDKEIRSQGFFFVLFVFFIIEDIIYALIFDHREPQCYFNKTLFKKSVIILESFNIM